MNNQEIINSIKEKINRQITEESIFLNNEDWACGDMGDMQSAGAVKSFCLEMIEFIKKLESQND